MVSGIFLLSAGTGYSPTYFTQNSKNNKKRKPVAFFFRVKMKEMYMKSNRDCERSSIISSMKSLWSIARNVSDMLLESPKFQVSEKHPPSWNVINQNGQENFEKEKKEDWHEYSVVVHFSVGGDSTMAIHYTKGHHLTGGLTRAPMYPWSSQQPTLFFFFGFKLIQSNASACVLLSTYSWKDFLLNRRARLLTFCYMPFYSLW